MNLTQFITNTFSRLRIAVILLLFFTHHLALGQTVIKGNIYDEQTKEPLAFVHVIFNNNEKLGTITDINGNFAFRTNERLTSLTCSYTGYENHSLELINTNFKSSLAIGMKATSVQLKELVISAIGDPGALRIMRKVIANKKLNNPKNIPSYSYNSYNKVIYNFVPNNTEGADSLQSAINKRLGGGYPMIMESVTHKKYLKPNKEEETVIGTKVSGFKHPSFAPLATDLQPSSFYEDIIPILDGNYVNPVSKGSLTKYLFSIEDTIFQGQDSVFVLAYSPKTGKHIDALEGLLYINSNRYAIQNVIAKPSDPGFVHIKIQQKYELINQQHWFPVQLNFELGIKEYPSKEIGLHAEGKSYISNIELNKELVKKDFSVDVLKIDDSASSRDSTFWENYRAKALTPKEETTYHVIDSIGQKYKFEAILNVMEKSISGRIPVKFVDLSIPKLVSFNNFEGIRLGLGLHTNEKISKRFSLNGFFGFGTEDKQWKYGGGFKLHIDKEHEVAIRGIYQHELAEVGGESLKPFNTSLNQFYTLRDFLASNMDRIEQTAFSFDFRAMRYFKINLLANHTFVKPQYDYSFTQDGNQELRNYRYSNLGFQLRFAYGERFAQSFNQRVSLGTKYPIFYFNYLRGLKILDGELEFNRIEAKVEQTFYTKSLGETRFVIEGGFIDTPLPYGLLFTGEGGYDRNQQFVVKNHFQTSTPYEFLSDRYMNIFFTHNFKALLFQLGPIKPHLILHQNMGWGDLSEASRQQQIIFSQKNRGFFESGLQLDNLLKLKYFNIGYFGFGAAAFYRYGPYANQGFNNNLVVKASLNFTTK